MANAFDRFDAPAPGNATSTNPFDAFDEQPASEPMGLQVADQAPVPSFNMARGALERSGDLLGGLFTSANALAERGEASHPLGGLVWEDGLIPDYKGPEDYAKWRAEQGGDEPLKLAADYWADASVGYQENHTWERVKQEFSEGGALSGSAWAEVMAYGAEQGVKSIPDMVAAVVALPTYITARSGEIGTERAKNKGKAEADLTDVLEAAPAAIGSALLERLGAKGITEAGAEALGKEALKRGLGKMAKEGAKAGGKEAATEFMQEGIIEYLGEKFGTGVEMSVGEALDRGAAGAVAGGVYGTGAGTAGAAVNLARQPGLQPPTDDAVPPVLSDPIQDAPAPDQGVPVLQPTDDPAPINDYAGRPEWATEQTNIFRDGVLPETTVNGNPFDVFDQAVPTQADAQPEAAPEPQAAPDGLTESGTGVFRVPVDQIKVDPEQYQFRSRVNEQGVDKRLEGVTQWDDDRAGFVLLHKRENGDLYVADGHHRVDLARKLNQGEINARIIDEADGESVADVRVKAAMTNIADGKAEPLDVAKVFRDSEVPLPEVRKAYDLPNNQVSRDGEALAKLSDNVFGMVAAGQLSEKDGAAIGSAFDDARQQETAVKAFQNLKPTKDYERELVLNEVRAAEFAENAGEQSGLFGDDPQEISLMQERMKVLDSLRQQLNADKRLFKSLNNNVDRASEAGNKIAKKANADITERSARSLDLIGRVTTTPDLNAMVNQAARRVYDGEDRSTVAKALKQELLNYERGSTEPSGERPANPSGQRTPVTSGQESGRNQPVPEADPVGADQSGQSESEVAPTLDLEPQTEEQLAEQAAARDAAEKAEAEQRKQAEQKEKADAEADDFVLSGSDSAVDQAEARGQGNMFDAPAETQSSALQKREPQDKADGLLGERTPEAMASLVAARDNPNTPKLNGALSDGEDSKGNRKPEWREAGNGFEARQYVWNGKVYQEVRHPNGNVATRSLEKDGTPTASMDAGLDDLLTGKAFNDFNQFFNRQAGMLSQGEPKARADEAPNWTGKLEAYAQQQDAIAADWASRQYKKSKQSIDLEGDGPRNSESISVNSVNEKRRRRRVNDALRNAKMARELAKQDQADALARYGKQYDRVSQWPTGRHKGDTFKNNLIIQLNKEFAGEKDSIYGENTLGAIIHSALESEHKAATKQKAEAKAKEQAEEKAWQDEVKAREERRAKMTDEERRADDEREGAELLERFLTPPEQVEQAAAEVDQNPTEAQKEADARQPETPIEDFGEKIEGARKDYASKLAAAKDKDVASVPLSESWPEPDYEKLLAAGADPEAVSFAHAARDEVPPKPRAKWKLKGWVRQVEALRNFTESVLDGDVAVNDLRDFAKKDRYHAVDVQVFNRADLYAAVGHDKSLKGLRFYPAHFTIYEGEHGNFNKWLIERVAKTGSFGNMPRKLVAEDTKEQAIEAFRKVHAELDGKEKTAKHTRFDIYSSRHDRSDVFIGKKIGRDVVRVKEGFTTPTEARAYLAENQAELERTLDKMKHIPNHRKAGNSPRVGKDHRNGGDVTPEAFAEAFGFRGVQFGNYVEQGRRQQDLNEAYDGLMDLAGILNVPPKALSLNGELGLAFGARGKGGKNAAMAHYEPGNIVINLTKKQGAGSLAHEWWHSLDNYFGRERGGKPVENYATAGRPDASVRPEVTEALAAIRKTVNRIGMRERAKRLDRMRTKAYWSTDVEMTARAFESYVIEKLKDQGAANEYLSNIVSEEYWKASEALGMEEADSYPYPEAAEIPEVRAAYDQLFQVIETKETDGGSVAMFSRNDPRFMFAGPQADTSDLTELERARDMAKDGRPMPAIRRETGWSRGVDGMWRYEISDDQARLLQSVSGKHETTMLDTLLDHPKLFAAYPRLANIPVYLDAIAEDGSYGTFVYGRGITLNTTRTDEQILSTLLHEIQHAIQDSEGFATGGNSDRDFVEAIKDALSGQSDMWSRRLERWFDDNQDLIQYVDEQADLATYALMYQSSKRLMDYANSDRPSGMLRHIKNEMGWVYSDKVRQDPDLARRFDELERNWYSLPKRHKMRERNLFLRDQAGDAAILIREAIPREVIHEFDTDTRKLPSMIKALERSAAKARRQLEPMRELQSKAKAAEAVAEQHRFSGPYAVYRALAGEIEARNTQARQSMTDAERQQTPPSSTADTADEQAIVVMKGRGGLTIEVPYRMESAGFRRTPTQASPNLTAAQAESITDTLMADWKGKPKVVIADRISEFPKRLRDAIRAAQAEGDMRGVYFEGKVYILASRIPSRAALEEVVLHEVVGHYGLRTMMGAELKPLLNRVYLSFAKSDKAKEIIRNYYPNGDFNASNVNHRLTVAEELLAHLAETGKHQKLWHKIVAAVRDGLRRLGFTLEMTETDLLGILAGAQKTVEQGGVSRPSEADNHFRRAFHGTPHRFDKFSLAAMGTGEGAQAYGWGLYFAGNRKVAEYYRATLSDANVDFDNLNPAPKGSKADVFLRHLMTKGPYFTRQQVSDHFGASDLAMLEKYGSIEFDEDGQIHVDALFELELGSVDILYQDNQRAYILRDGSALVDTGQGELKAAMSDTGNLYEVEIPDDSDYLDWDMPLSKQPKGVVEKLAPVLDLIGKEKPFFQETIDEGLIRGQTIYTALHQSIGTAEKASRRLAELGIPGLRYLDGSSRHRSFKEIRDEFLTELPEDAEIEDVVELFGTGAFSPDNEMLLTALNADDWLGFDYPAQAVSTVLGDSLPNYDPSPGTVDAVARLREEGDRNYVIWDESVVSVQAVNDEIAQAEAYFSRQGNALNSGSDQQGAAAMSREGEQGQADIISGDVQGGVKLYHGTDDSFIAGISEDGLLKGPAYFTPRKDMAEEYADGGPVVSVKINPNHVKIDFDLPGGRLLTVAEANKYAGNDGWTLNDYLADGQSVGVEESVAISSNQIESDEDVPSFAAANFSRTGQKQTDTDAFRKWFGDSKVVDENGAPLVVYHGTNESFTEFDRGQLGKNTAWNDTRFGFYFADNQDAAAEFGSNLIPAYVAIEKPLRLTPNELFSNRAQAATVYEAMTGERLSPSDALSAINDEIGLGELSDALESLATEEGRSVIERDGYDGVISDMGDGTLQYAAFRPNQIKSATGNTGAFDPDNADIRFSRTGRQSFETADDTLIRKAVALIADKFTVLKGIQQNIEAAHGEIAEDANAYQAEELFHGKVENDLRLLRESMIEPLAKKMSEYGVSLPSLDEFLYAMHAPERNRVIAQRDPERPDGGSGMTNAEAAAIINKVDQDGKLRQYKELAGQVHAMLAKRREILNENGLLDDETRGAWEEAYRHYVPLKGFAADETQDSLPHAGKGFAISGPESKMAAGRKSKAASPVANTVSDLTEAVLRHRKNEVGNTFLKLVHDHPNSDLWQIYTADNPEVERKAVRVKDPKTGKTKIEVRETVVPMAMMQDRYFTTKVNGDTYYIKIGDPRLMAAMKNLGPDNAGLLVRSLSAVTRLMSSLNTSYNPEFVISNFSRDIQTALLNLSSEQSAEGGKVKGKAIVAQTLKDVPFAIRAINASLKGDKALSGRSGEMQREFDRFRADGAKTGWFDMKDLDGQRAELETMIGMASGGFTNMSRRAFHAVTDWVEHTNSAIENGVRLAAYVNAIQAGIPRTRAASLAKNMTVNFNRRGELGTTMNALYMFANASVQGTANFVRTLGRLNGQKGDKLWSRFNTAQKIAAGMAVGGFALSMLNRLVAGEDDDGENWWDKVPDYVKERNIVIMKSLYGGEPGEYWTIPLPYGYNIFPLAGSSLEHLAFSSQSAGKIATNLTLGALGSFSPIGFEDSDELHGLIGKNVAPTILKPLVTIPLNENFAGGPLYKEDFPFGTPKPDSTLSFRNTPQLYKTLAETLNRATGGSDYRSGAVDLSPDVMDYLVGYYGGGAYDFFTNRTPNFGAKWLQGVELEAREVPFLRKLHGKVLPYEDQSKFYDRRDEINQLTAERDALKGADRARFLRDHGNKLRLSGAMNATEKRLKLLRKKRDRIEALDDLTAAEKDVKLQEVERLMKRAIDQFNKRYGEMDG
ncbi:LPD38 domain-containing protein [Marinobacter sp. MDS2]|uniref:LPD38 domain-containing protein n=1 Tax=Marinobacter sp. MDS2 TaxID=3065961 RepID=UPI00273ADA6B|nr:LPD38 domain-containing protein [Marinobacter sp. MDS2]MDP4546475.1 LPD38 domain-containing protein [Marinobacter sp. MDS2]